MSQPPPYSPVTSFITYQATQSWFPGQNLDVEFNALQTSIKAIETNLALIQEDDGTLANGSVDFPQLSTDLATALAAIGVAVPISTVLTQVNTWTHLQSFPGNIAVGSGAALGDISFPFTGANNTVTIGGGTNAGGFPHLLFQASAALVEPNTILVGFGTSNTWPFPYNDYQGNTVSIIDPYGTGSLAIAMRSSDRRTGSPNPVNLNITTVHDNPSAGSPASHVWGTFHIAWKTAAAYGSGALFFGEEQSVVNLGASVVGDPYNVNPADGTFGLRIDNGDGPVAVGIYDPTLLQPVTNAINIVANGVGGTGTFNAGICFGSGSIQLVGGHLGAIQMAKAHEIQWFASAGTLGGLITTDAAGVLQLFAAAGTVNIYPAAGFALLNWGNNGTNYLTANNGISSVLQMQVNSVVLANWLPSGFSMVLATEASSTSVASVTLAGGIGIAKKAFIGGDTNIGGVINGASTINAATNYTVAGTQVVAARATGWTVATGTPQRSTFTTGGVTLAQLAGVVMALEQDLIAHGLIGA